MLTEEATYINFIIRSGLSRLPLGPTIYRTRRGHHYTIDAASEFFTVFSGVCVAQFSIFCVVFCRSFVCPFVLFFWPLCCLSFFWPLCCLSFWALCCLSFFWSLCCLSFWALCCLSFFWPLCCLSFFFWPLCCLCFFFWPLCCLSCCWPLCCLSFFFWPLCCLSFFFWPLCCLSFFFWPLYCLSVDLRILITPLISSNSS